MKALISAVLAAVIVLTFLYGLHCALRQVASTVHVNLSR
jgi:hypothetical protein